MADDILVQYAPMATFMLYTKQPLASIEGLNTGSFAQELLTGVDPNSNVLTIGSPLPAVAPIYGSVTVSSTPP